MVNRKDRAVAEHLIRELVECRITNDEFDEKYPHGSKDLAVRNIWRCVWTFWDDRETHTLQGEHRLSPKQQAFCERCIRFLQTDLEYTGSNVNVGFLAGLKRLLGHSASADVNSGWWPFASEEQYRGVQENLAS